MHGTNGSVHAVLDRTRAMPDDRGFVESWVFVALVIVFRSVPAISAAMAR